MRRFKLNTDGAGLTPEEIADNFSDLHPPLDSAQAAVEAARCIYCYDAPCMNACPTRIDIPKFIHQIRSQNIEGSALTILSSNIMGGTCARACPTEVLCEEVCVVNQSEGAPVKIGELQRFAVDGLMAKTKSNPFSRAKSNGKRAAVIGAGPAGLSFAHQMAMFGHEVVVYEAKPNAGGLNQYGLAAYKMANDFAQKEVEFILDIGGITIENGKALGKDIKLEDLQKEFDAVFIGVGLMGNRALNVPGEDFNGVDDALDFIENIRESETKSKITVGENVVVIGGGNTAIDAAVQAKCLGARNVTLVYRRGPEDMGATRWEQELAASNGVAMRYWAAPHSFAGSKRVEKAVFSETSVKNGKLLTSGATFEILADMVLKAVGQTLIDKDLNALKIQSGKIVVDDYYRTSLKGVYAGGDCVAVGQDLTVQAVQDGKLAAIHADLEVRGIEGGSS